MTVLVITSRAFIGTSFNCLNTCHHAMTALALIYRNRIPFIGQVSKEMPGQAIAEAFGAAQSIRVSSPQRINALGFCPHTQARPFWR
jgi:hypothetical protein